jgi:hypothetical protein
VPYGNNNVHTRAEIFGKHKTDAGQTRANVSPLGNLSVETYHQPKTSNPIIVNFNQVQNSTTLNGAVATGDRTIVVTDATGFAVGRYVILFDPVSIRFTTFYATVVAGTTITLDGPLDFAYPDGTIASTAITDLAVNGAVTTQVFGIRGTGTPPGVELTLRVTRIVFEMICDSAVDLSLFGNIARLTNGLLLRSRNGTFKNIFNVKDNAEIAGTMFDWQPFESINPIQGVDGFVARLTFGSEQKLGVVLQLPIGEDLEVHVQDDLTGITSFKMWAEGYITDE